MLKTKKRLSRKDGIGTPETKQFDFEQHWDSMIVPHLNDRYVVTALTLGMQLRDQSYTEGEPPWMYGQRISNGEGPKRDSLAWYQPWGCGHYIAPFCWALGQKLYPNLRWGFVSSNDRSVVVGWSDDWKKPDWVMDILLYRVRSVEEALDHMGREDCEYYESLTRHVASTYVKPEANYRWLMKEKKKAGFLPGNEGAQWIEKLIELHQMARKNPVSSRLS